MMDTFAAWLLTPTLDLSPLGVLGFVFLVRLSTAGYDWLWARLTTQRFTLKRVNGDVLVVTTSRKLTPEQAQHIKTLLAETRQS